MSHWRCRSSARTSRRCQPRSDDDRARPPAERAGRGRPPAGHTEHDPSGMVPKTDHSKLGRYIGAVRLIGNSCRGRHHRASKLARLLGCDNDQSPDSMCSSQRGAARKERRFADADRIRAELAAEGIILEDKPDGTTEWRRAWLTISRWDAELMRARGDRAVIARLLTKLRRTPRITIDESRLRHIFGSRMAASQSIPPLTAARCCMLPAIRLIGSAWTVWGNLGSTDDTEWRPGLGSDLGRPINGGLNTGPRISSNRTICRQETRTRTVSNRVLSRRAGFSRRCLGSWNDIMNSGAGKQGRTGGCSQRYTDNARRQAR